MIGGREAVVGGECSSRIDSVSCQFDETVCIICHVSFSDSTDKDVSEVSRGLERLIEYSEKYGDIKLQQKQVCICSSVDNMSAVCRFHCSSGTR